jgi:hypothetical protein
MDLQAVTADTFRPHLGSTFTVEFVDGKTLELTLNEVNVLLTRQNVPRLTRDTFGIYFSGPNNMMFPQGIYALRHDVLGTMEVFIVPKGQRPDGGINFEAIFT